MIAREVNFPGPIETDNPLQRLKIVLTKRSMENQMYILAAYRGGLE